MFSSYSSGLTLIPFHRSISYINSSRETAFRSFHVFLGRNTDVHIILLIFSVRNKSCLLLSETSTFSLPQLTSCSYCEHCLCCLLLILRSSSTTSSFRPLMHSFNPKRKRKDKGRFVLYDGQSVSKSVLRHVLRHLLTDTNTKDLYKSSCFDRKRRLE